MGAKKVSQSKVNRVYSNKKEFDQDCFKLEVSKMYRNETSYYGDNPGQRRAPIITPIEHCHFFYTVDKKGKKQTMSCATGGHKHEIEWWVDENGDLKAKCGPPIEHGGNIFKGDRQNPPDTHTHEVTYIKSSRVNSNIRKDKAKEIIQYAARVDDGGQQKQTEKEQKKVSNDVSGFGS